MLIEFVVEVSEDWYDGTVECHKINVDGKPFMWQYDNIEPEDVRFYRDLGSPHHCEKLLKTVIEAAKAGEEIIIEHKKVNIDERT